jgi:hypothetical protein
MNVELWIYEMVRGGKGWDRTRTYKSPVVPREGETISNGLGLHTVVGVDYHFPNPTSDTGEWTVAKIYVVPTTMRGGVER